MKEIPEFARGARVIKVFDPQPEVRKNAENASDWEFTEEAVYLYRMATLFKERFLDPIIRNDRNRLPDPVISFENLRNLNTLAAYRLNRNPQGLLYEIIMNAEHYVDVTEEGKIIKQWSFGKWAQLETLLHEQVHLWQQNFGKDPVRPGRAYHNKEFVQKCESLGLHPKLGPGYHTQLANGAFGNLMKELGIEPPHLTEQAEKFDLDWFFWYLDSLGKRREGKSSLHKWTCPECGLNARMGVKGDPKIRHDPCEQKTGHEVFFVQIDNLSHTIYKNPEGEISSEGDVTSE